LVIKTCFKIRSNFGYEVEKKFHRYLQSFTIFHNEKAKTKFEILLLFFFYFLWKTNLTLWVIQENLKISQCWVWSALSPEAGFRSHFFIFHEIYSSKHYQVDFQLLTYTEYNTIWFGGRKGSLWLTFVWLWTNTLLLEVFFTYFLQY
jgi:hypothetical protein